MNPIDKLRTSYKPPVDYIEKLSYTVDIKQILLEKEVLKSLDWHDSFMQLKFSLKLKCVWHEIINSMPYTKTVLDMLHEVVPYNSVYYRYIKPNTCYNWHVDKMATCLHIPLITNAGCKFVYEDKVFSMPSDGSVYIVNNSIPHTFVNAGKEPRLHITMDIF